MEPITMTCQKVFENSEVRKFNWHLADASDRRSNIENTDVAATLVKIQRKYDPSHKKTLARLRRLYLNDE